MTIPAILDCQFVFDLKEDIETVKKMILDNSAITIREVADEIGISFGSCQAIFTDVLGMKRVAAKIVPIVASTSLKRC